MTSHKQFDNKFILDMIVKGDDERLVRWLEHHIPYTDATQTGHIYNYVRELRRAIEEQKRKLK